MATVFGDVRYWRQSGRRVKVLQCPLLTHSSGHAAQSSLVAAGLFGRNDWGDLSDKASAPLEGYVAPQPGYGDNETIPDAN
jgi:hypothetical protein